MRAMRINGHIVKCKMCRKYNASMIYSGVPVCNRCLRPFLMGYLCGRAKALDSDESEDSRW